MAAQTGHENATEFYHVRFSSGEALATLAVLRALDQVTTSGPLTETDIEPGILASAAQRLGNELPDFVVGRAERLAAALARTLREAAAGSPEDDAEIRDAPPFPIRRNRRLLEDAYEERQPVEIEYYVSGRKEWTHRRVDISSVHAQNGTWYLSGQCGLRNDHRQFRLDHIRSVHVLDDGDDAPDPFAE